MLSKRKTVNKKRVSVALPRRISGSGAYKVRPSRPVKSSNRNNYIKAGLQGGGALAGGSLASYMGLPSGIGSALGGVAGSLLSKITGHGSYDIKPEILSRINRNTILKPDNIPAFGHVGDGTRIQHREYVGDIFSSVAFSNNVFPIQIASSKTFPWASQMAPLYSQYKVLGMVFEFRSMYSDSVVSTSANASLGSLIGCCEYNANALPFINSVQMQNALFAESCKPSNSVIFAIECDFQQTPSLPLYTSLTNGYQDPSVANDARLNTLGNFQIATVGNQSDGQNLGQLWVSYDIMLYKQQLDIPKELPLFSARYNILNSNDTMTLKPLGVGQTKLYDTVGLSFPLSLTPGNVMIFDKGNKGDYLVWFQNSGSFAFSPVNNCQYLVAPTNCSVIAEFATSAGLNTTAENGGLTNNYPMSSSANMSNNCFIVRITDASLVASIAIGSMLPSSDFPYFQKV